MGAMSGRKNSLNISNSIRPLPVFEGPTVKVSQKLVQMLL